MTICMGMAQPDFKHEFVATDLDTWGQEIDTSNDPKSADIPLESPRSETSELAKLFAKFIKEMTNLHKALSPVKLSNHRAVPELTGPRADTRGLKSISFEVRNQSNQSSQIPSIPIAAQFSANLRFQRFSDFQLFNLHKSLLDNHRSSGIASCIKMQQRTRTVVVV